MATDAGHLAKATMQKLRIHSPVPTKLQNEIVKSADILEHFIKGNNELDAKLIPEKIIANAKGIAVITFFKVGFLWSGRVGSGVVVARLPDGNWSAPSAIAALSVGFGGQIGASLTDCVFILNNDAAVKAFSHGGNVTLGGNLSAAAGPKGRAAEAAGAIMNLAPIYSYSKSKGLFVGASLEGTVIVTRNDANEKLYSGKVTPESLLTGRIPPPIEAEHLYRVLNTRFANLGTGTIVQVPFNRNKSTNQQSDFPTTDHKSKSNRFLNKVGIKSSPSSARTSSTQQQKQNDSGYVGSSSGSVVATTQNTALDAVLSLQPGAPAVAAEKSFGTPVVATATALYDFTGERESDLSFRAGERIEVLRMAGAGEWWRGRRAGVEGDFPGNYVAV
ncbi:hypothetical protein HDV00_012282 [Rhizophlyctis rosea]|nr:hypothetical protein HDV00_012282 [Rhizophlyctis rosea]